MALYKRGKTWWMSYTVNGELRRESTRQTNKKRAEGVWSDTLQSLKDGTYVPVNERPEAEIAPPFEIALEAYLEDRDRRGKRADSYRKLADWRGAFEGRSIRAITLDDVESKLAEWMGERGWSPATYNNALSQLSGVFTFAYRKGWIDRHPLKGRAERMQANNARQRWLRTVEVEAVADAAVSVARKQTPDAPEVWLREVVLAAVGTGLRRGKLCDLRCYDVERDEAGDLYLFVGKDKNGEPIHKPLVGRLREIVERRLENAVAAAHLFPGPNGGSAYHAVGRYLPVTVRLASMQTPGVMLRWGRSRRDGITFHTFRHSMASLAANNGVPLDVVQKMGNWKTATMMRRYAHLADERVAAGEARLAEVLHISSQSEKSAEERKRVSG